MGIANRMRGLGNVGVYKYNHCTTKEQMTEINRNYKNDVDFKGEWNYKLDNLTNAAQLMSGSTSLIRCNIELPNATSITEAFKNCTELETLTIKAEKAATCQYVAMSCSKLKSLNCDVPAAATTGIYGAAWSCGFIENININAPNVTNSNDIVKQMQHLVNVSGNQENNANGYLLFQNNYSLSKCDLKFPKLTDGRGMFENCMLDKSSSIGILDSLPTYTSGNYTINIGIDKLLENDVDVLSSIDGAKNKGWNVVVNWSDSYNENEILPESLMEKLEINIELPEGYKRLLYLKDDARNYINTNYIPTKNTGLYVIAKQLYHSDAVPMGMCNSSDWANNISAPRWHRRAGNSGGYYSAFYYWSSTGNGKAYEGLTNFKNDRIIKIDNNINVYTKTAGNFTWVPKHPIYLFAINRAGIYTTYWRGCIYRAKISEGEDIVRDYIPCLDNNGIPCMYEIIEGKPYYTESTKYEFRYGMLPT